MKTNFIKLIAAATAIVGCVHNAAATVYYTIGDKADLEQFNVTFNHTAYNNINAGGIKISQLGGAGHPINNSMPLNYVSICTDFLGSLYVGSTYSYSSPAVSFAGQTGIAPAWNNPTEAIQNAAKIFYTYGQLTSGGVGGSVENMAAVQLAVWMSLYDTVKNANGTYSVVVNSSSEFYVSTSNNGSTQNKAIADALSWIGTLNGTYNYTGYLLKPDPLTSQGNSNGHLPQELLIAVPEPGTILGGALLLLPLAVGTFRMLRKPKTA